MRIENIPIDVLFESNSLQEFVGGAVGGGGFGYYAGQAYGQNKAAKELNEFIRANNLNPDDPKDKERIRFKKKLLSRKYGLSSKLMGAGAGVAAGSALGIMAKLGRGE